MVKIQNKKTRYIKYSFLKENNLTVRDIAKIFGYRSERSFRSSSAYRDMMESISELVELITLKLKEQKEKERN